MYHRNFPGYKHLQQKELEYLGFNLTYNLFENIEAKHLKYHATYIQGYAGKTIGTFEKLKKVLTKNKEEMVVGSFSDGRSLVSFVLFPKELKSLKTELEYNQLYRIEYTIRMDQKSNQNQLIIKNVIEC